MLEKNKLLNQFGTEASLLATADLRRELFGEAAPDTSCAGPDPGADNLAVPSETDAQPPLPSSDEASGHTPSEEDILTDLQSRFGLLDLGGVLYWVSLDQLKERTRQGAATPLRLSNLAVGQLKMRRYMRGHYAGVDAKALAAEFITHPDTICFMGTELNPKETTESYLNLYVPPAIAPVAGDCTPVEAFIFEVVCSSDFEVFGYLIKYLAHAYQKPWEKPGVMLVLIGGQGIGKGTFCELLRQIWRPTYLQVNDIKEVVGNFNASLERALWVVMDEALFAGYRRETDRMKSLITEPDVLISEKYQPARTIESYHRFVMTTNACHAKHVETDDRRDFVLRVSDQHKGDLDYWSELRRHFDPASLAALVYQLQLVDLAGFNVRKVPTTPAKTEQKILSLGPTESYWLQCLQEGALPDHEDWSDFIATQTLLDAVNNHGARPHRKPTLRDITQTVMALCPSAYMKQKRGISSSRARGLVLPSLEVARAEFSAWIGGDITW
jgi:hypothetical protein